MARKKTKKRPSKSKAPKKQVKLPSLKLSRKQKVVLGSFLMLFGFALLIAFSSFLINWQIDQSELSQLSDRNVQTRNWLSSFGAGISNFFIYKGFGVASFSLAILTFLTGFYLFLNLNSQRLKAYWFWGVLLMVWLSVFFGFFAEKNAMLGGTVGFETNDYLQDYLGLIGTILLMLFLAIVYLVFRLKITPERISVYFKKASSDIKEEFASDEEAPINTMANEKASVKQDIVPDSPENTTTEEVVIEQQLEPIVDEPKITSTTIEASNEDDISMEVETTEEEEVSETKANKLVEDFGEFDPKLELSNYKFPTIELLKDYSNSGGITINQEELEENKNKIVETLKNYKIGIDHIKATVGPTVTLYEIIPEAGIRISKIKNLEDDIALSLAALGIRIIAPIPGKGTVGIEVPNKNPRIVSMRSTIASPKFQNAEMELPIAFGKTISNETMVVDLAKMPHLLMAGATGQGKSVGLNAVLTSLLYKKHPAEVKFVLVDPKKVELTLFNKIERHYLAKLPDSEEAIITDNTKVINTLNSLCIEMDNRYEMLKNAMCRNIKEYNEKFKARKLNPNEGHQFLPYIVLVVDEFADLIMTAGKEVETPIARLAQLARAIGIHLIVATQRPSVNVITGIIKANFLSLIHI